MVKTSAVGVLTGAICLVMIVAVAGPAHAEDWQVESGDERQQRIIDRYQEMLEEEPVEGMALNRLLGHVGRGAGLDRLISHYESRVDASPDNFNLRLVLGHLLKARGDYDEAFAQYDHAIELDRNDSLGWLSRGTIRLLTGERAQAMEDFEEALERESDRERRHELMQQLGEISFSQREFERGMEFFDRRIDASPNDQFLRMEYVSLLVQYRQLDEAIAQYQVLRRLLSGDTRQLATLLRDKADVYEMMGDDRAALETYEEAKDLVRSDSWLAREIRQQIVGVYRGAGRLDDFLDDYGGSWRRGSTEQRMMVADVYGELGRLEEALDLYEALARRDRSAVEPREKAIRVLERLGRDDEVPNAYLGLIRAAPNDERYAFELAEFYVRSGDRDAARDVLDDVRGRFSGQSYVLLELAEYYAQWNFGTDAEETYEAVLQREPDDDAVLIQVGDYYFDRGNRQRALDIWEKLPDSQLGSREGSRRMAELLVQRGIIDEGIDAFEKLIEETPEDERLLRAMSRALERANRWDEAMERWEQLLALSDAPQRQREARARIVELYDRQQELRARMRQWEEELNSEDGSQAIDAGFFLAEAHLHMRDLDLAEEVLSGLRDRDDLSDEERTSTLLALEQTYVRGDRFEDAIAVLEELSEHQPDMRRELLERKSEHALAGQFGDSAVEYASRALETNPDDARAQAKMGRVLRDLGNFEAAVDHFRTAADIDSRDHEVRLELGKALAELGRRGEAEDSLMAVVEDASQDQLVRDAGEILLALAEEAGQLEALENRWAPLVFRMPVRDAHAQLMFQLYDLIAGPLLLQVYHGSSRERDQAREWLDGVGGRAAPLMVEQLQRDSAGPRARALRMVAEMRVDVAAPQVARVIAHEDDERIRKMAIVAAARLGDTRFVDPLSGALDDGSATVRHLSTWALGYIDSDEAREVLTELADTEVDGTGPRLAIVGLAQTMQQRERELMEIHLRRLVADPVGIERDRAALLLSAVAADIARGEGEEFRPMIEELADDRLDPIGFWAARVLGTYDDTEASSRLWKMALDEDRLVARRGELGLLQMLAGVESTPRRWSDEIRYFDWTNTEFEARRFLRHRGRQLFGIHPDVAPDMWSTAVDQGLRQALESEEIDSLVQPALGRMGSRFENGETAGLWHRQRAAKFATAILEQRDADQLSAGVQLQLEVLDASRAADLEAISTRDFDQPADLLGAIALGRFSGPMVLPAQLIVDSLRSSDRQMRRMALRAVAAVQVDDAPQQELAEAVLEALNDDDMAVQIAAIAATQRLGLDGADEILADLERDARPALRRAVRQARRSLDSGAD